MTFQFTNGSAFNGYLKSSYCNSVAAFLFFPPNHENLAGEEMSSPCITHLLSFHTFVPINARVSTRAQSLASDGFIVLEPAIKGRGGTSNVTPLALVIETSGSITLHGSNLTYSE